MGNVNKIKDLVFEKQKPIELIKLNKSTIEITNEGLKFLNSIDEKFGICVCVGPYRQGKSFLLNRLFGLKTGFEVGHTDLSCTQGAWIWREPMTVKQDDGSEIKMFIVDTEGLESNKNEWDSKLFLISFLISSIFLYNTKNALSADSIQKLSAVSVLKKTLLQNNPDIKESCPDFIWIVRDYSLNSTLQPMERLNQFLKQERVDLEDKTRQTEIEAKNQIKNNFQDAFKSLDCVYIPVPVTDGTDGLTYEEALQSLDKINPKHLRASFNYSVHKLKEKISDKSSTKTVGNQEFNGPMFAEYLKEIIKLVNTESNIFLNSVLGSSVKSVADMALEEARVFYTSEMKSFVWIDKQPVKWDMFKDTECEIKFDSYQIIKDKIKYASNDLCNQYVAKFNEFREIKNNNVLIGGKLYEFKQINKTNIQVLNEKKARQAWRSEIEWKYSDDDHVYFSSKTDFQDELKKFKTKLKNDLFELEDFESFWALFSTKCINLNEIILKIDDKIKLAEEKSEREAIRLAKIEAQIQESRKRYQNLNDSRSNPDLGSYLTQFERSSTPYLTPSSINSPNHNYASSGIDNLRYSGYPSTPISLNTTRDDIYLRMDGKKDLRFKENRAGFISPEGIHITKSGKPDMRFKLNKQLFGTKQQF